MRRDLLALHPLNERNRRMVERAWSIPRQFDQSAVVVVDLGPAGRKGGSCAGFRMPGGRDVYGDLMVAGGRGQHRRPV